ncbi:MAG: hypothetical protein CVU24_17455 [Betaproteobacteria bacterium HGW-Betaproteobacteria-18]|nr:MAG: hypothetical protein CVU24_17455 [Betaproteobacteria bacterium HGW-Betaproteobacteria-18]
MQHISLKENLMAAPRSLGLALLMLLCLGNARAAAPQPYAADIDYLLPELALTSHDLHEIIAGFPSYAFDEDYLLEIDARSGADDQDEEYFELHFYALRRDNSGLFEDTVPPVGLEKAVLDALRHNPQRIVHVRYHGRDYVVKRMDSKTRSRLKQVMVRWLCGMCFPGHACSGSLPPQDGHFEANRVRALGKAGMRVARVALELDQAVVYTHCGINLRKHLAGCSGDEQHRLLHAAVRDLAGFHHAGHWHGGAQFRNLLLNDGQFYRIDFEEDLEHAISLPLAQIYDICQFLSDAVRYGNEACSASELSHQLLKQYQSVYWSDTHQHLLAGVSRLLHPLEAAASLLQRLNFKDFNRALVLVSVLRRHAGGVAA